MQLCRTKWRKIKTTFNVIHSTVDAPILLQMACGTVAQGSTITWCFSSIDKTDGRVIELRLDLPHREIVSRLEKFFGGLVLIQKTTIMDVLQWLIDNYDAKYLPLGLTAIKLHHYLTNHQELREIHAIFHSCENKSCYEALNMYMY